MRQAKKAGKKVSLVRDKLYIEGILQGTEAGETQTANSTRRSGEFRDVLLDHNTAKSPPVPPRLYKRVRRTEPTEPTDGQSDLPAQVIHT